MKNLHVLMRKAVLLGIAWNFFYGAPLYAAEPSAVQPILSASEYDYPPFALVTPEGQVDGFSVELLAASLKAMKREVSFTVGPWSEIKQELADGKIQVLPLVGRTPEREEIFDFTFSYLTMHGAIFVRQDEDRIQGVADLHNKEVMVMQDDNAHEYVVRDTVSSEIILTKTYEQAMRLLSEGKHDAVIVQKLVGLQLIDKLEIENLRTAGPPLSGFKQSFSFAVHEGDKELLALLNEGLSIAIADGTLERLRQKWFGPLEESQRYQLVVCIFIAVAVSFLFSWLVAYCWQGFLRRKVKEKTRELQASMALLRKNEEKLTRSEQRYRQIFEENTAIKLLIDPEEGNIVDANSAASKFYGYDPGTLKQKSIQDLAADLTTKNRKGTDNAAAAGAGHFFGRHRQASGEVRDVEMYSGPIETSTRQLVFFIVHDVTERKQLEDELLLAKKEAETASETKSRFLALMSHEIRTPLNSIVGFSNILLKQAEKMALKEEFQYHLQMINSNGNHLAELLSNILELSQVEAEEMELSTEVLDIKLLSESIFYAGEIKAAKKQQTLSYYFDDELPRLILSDRTKLNQILMHLLDNAIKYTERGKNIWMKIVQETEFIVFHVEDEGIGIPQEKQEEIFEAFEQVDGSRTRKAEGGGLGLAVVRKMVNLLGGCVSVQSQVGAGSVFEVRIPAIAVEPPQQPTATAIQDEIGFSTEAKILTVDDNPANQEMIRILFREMGIEIQQAGDGKEAVSKALEWRPDLILMDMHMPGMDGIETTRQIHQHASCEHIPVVALSAEIMREQKQRAQRAGIRDYLTKPLELPKLLDVLSKYLLKP